MIASVMLYLVAVSAVVGAAAWLADEGLRRVGVPTRWVWLAALATPLVLAVTAGLLPERAVAVVASGVPAAAVIELPEFVVDDAGSAGVGWSDGLLTLWLASVLATIVVVARAHRRLGKERRGWERENVDGRPVFVSSDRGPAAAGVLRPWIVVPRWILGLPPAQRALVLLHEEEHVRGGDTILLPFGLALASVVSWNPIVWWQLSRMRAAMEVDCDRRVLRRRPEPAVYGDSLLIVASRAVGTGLALAAFSERPGGLHRRILAMTDVRTRWTSFRATVLVLLAVAVAVQACGVEGPVTLDEGGIELAEVPPPSFTGPGGEGSEPAPDLSGDRDPRERVIRDPDFDPSEFEPPPTGEELRAEPTFTPFTVAPAITNRDEVVAMMEAEYPPLLREAGIGGTVRVFFLINEEGIVEQIRLDQSAGHPALDDAALNVAGAYRFTPALNGSRKVPVWVSFPITFRVREPPQTR
jgi:TonB family protein